MLRSTLPKILQDFPEGVKFLVRDGCADNFGVSSTEFGCFEGFTNVFCLAHLLAARITSILAFSTPTYGFRNSEAAVFDCGVSFANLSNAVVTRTLHTMARAERGHRLWTCLSSKQGDSYYEALRSYSSLYGLILDGAVAGIKESPTPTRPPLTFLMSNRVTEIPRPGVLEPDDECLKSSSWRSASGSQLPTQQHNNSNIHARKPLQPSTPINSQLFR